MKGRSRVANRAYWEEQVEAWRKSNLTQVAYCRMHTLNIATFGTWVARSKQQSSEGIKPLTLIPVVIRQDEQPPSPSPTLPSLCLRHTGGWELQLPTDVSPLWLGQVMKEIA